jgi:hypothetical protein
MEVTTNKKLKTKDHECREFNPTEIVNFFNAHKYLFWSWGANHFINGKNLHLRFTVNGNKHKGYVYIFLSFLDLFDIFFTDEENNIIDARKDVYLMDLFTTLDERIEN